MAKQIGRPMKYKNLIMTLDERVIYTPALIARFAAENGYIEAYEAMTPREQNLAKQRIRISLGRFAKNNGFPPDGDGMIRLPGQAPNCGWFGWRWQYAAEARTQEGPKILMAR